MAPALIQNDGNTVTCPDDLIPASKPSTKTSSVLHRSLHNNPSQVESGDGNYLTLTNGSRIFDATCGAAVTCLGHSNSRVLAAVQRQMSAFSYVHTFTFSTKACEDLAALLTASTGNRMTKAFIVSSGSEAMEAALKLARQYFTELQPPQRRRVNFISRRESYHGNTLGALGMSGHVARRALFEPILAHTTGRVDACNAYRGQLPNETSEAYVARLAKQLDDEFERLGPDTVCAFIAEPVVGAALGCVPYVAGYFEAMKAVCDKHGALLILDEIMSGMGRCGTLHAWEQFENVVPDIQTIAKGLGGGFMPIAGLLINKRVVDVLDKGTGAFSHGQTYQGHPVACAAALEVQRIIQEEGLMANVRKMGKLLEAGLRKGLQDHPHVGNIRGKGLFWGIEFVQNKATKEPFPAPRGIAMKVHEMGLREPHCISIYPGTGSVDGMVGDHVLLAPAYNIAEEDVELIVRRAVSVIEEVFKKEGVPA